ncbi:hypothetical protein B7463_g763, partial [Scytalidium lignicola]
MAQSGSNPFLITTPLAQPDQASRRNARSYAMRGKNRGKSVKRRVQAQPLVSWINGPSHGGEMCTNIIPRPVGSAWALSPFAVEVGPDMFQNVIKFYDVLNQASNPNPILVQYDGKPETLIWLGYLSQSQSYFHSQLFVVLTYLNMINRTNGKIDTVMTWHLTKALGCLQSDLAEIDKATTDATISVVSAFVSVALVLGDTASAETHLHGLFNLISLRGGLSSLRTQPSLQTKCCRLDLSYAISTCSKPLFFADGNISWDSYLSSSIAVPQYTLIHSMLHNDSSPDPKIVNVWHDLHELSRAANIATQTGQKLETNLFQERINKKNVLKTHTNTNMAISDIITSINAITNSPNELKPEEKVELLAACEKLNLVLEGPREKTMRLIIAIAIDMKLLDAAAELSVGGSEIQLDDLASKTGADPLLIVRIMRFLVGINLFKEIVAGKWTSTPLAAAYVTASPLAQAMIHMGRQNEIIANLPSYFEEKGYSNPGDAYNSPFQYTRKTNLHSFDWLATQPRLQHACNVVMGISRSAKGNHWVDYFPLASKLQVQSPSDVLLVDVGGGIGHDLITFQKRYPDLQGKLIVQDIPAAIDGIAPGSLPSGIEAMKHDFFSPQPVKGAKAYFLGNVLHDWPDKQASQILTNIRDAMNAESILLVSENVLPETNVPLYSASADFIMMANFASLERTEEQFRVLFDSVGLKLAKAWTLDDAMAGEGRRVLEVKLKN